MIRSDVSVSRRGSIQRIVLAVLLAGTAVFAVWRFWPEAAAPPPAPGKLLDQALETAAADPESAERLLRLAVKSSQGDFDDAELALATMLAADDKVDEATELFAGVRPEGCRSELLLSFGRQMLAHGGVEPALKTLSLLREREDIESIVALEQLLSHYHETKQIEAELDCAQELAERDPNNPARWWMLVGMLQARKATKLVIEVMSEASRQALPEQDRHEFQHQLIEALLYSGDAARGRIELERLLDEVGTTARTLVHEANLCRTEARFPEALAALEKAIPMMGPEKFREAIRLRAILYLDMGRFEEAAADLQQAIDEEPFDQVAHMKLADAFRGLNQFERAKEHQTFAESIKSRRLEINRLIGILDQEPNHVELCDQIAELYRELNEADSALKWERRASEAKQRLPAEGGKAAISDSKDR